jgi:kynureninase
VSAIDDLRDRADDLDAADELAGFRERFSDAPGVAAYLDGNSLGRPLRITAGRLAEFVHTEWGTGLIRSWDERWMDLPFVLGDRIAAATLGAGPGQTVVADSTTVLLYKLVRAAVAARPGRSEIVVGENDFPTDRFVVDAVAAELGATVRRVTAADPVAGLSVAEVEAAVGDDTAVAVLCHVDYRSGAISDVAGITAAVHRSGALVLWDLCHSAGVVPVELDAVGADYAVGCTYKYLNGGPGSPAFAYVRTEHQAALTQPIQGWMGAADVFAMAAEYTPAPGIRRMLSGTPPVLGMLPTADMLDLIEEAGLARIRAKSRTLTGLVVEAYDALLAPAGVRLLSPRDAARRGSHVTVGHASFADVNARLWKRGIIPDFRHPDGIRLGLSPLSTSHAEALEGVVAIRDEMPR